MKNIRLLIFLLLNINLLLSSDDLPNKPYYFSDNEFKKYCFDFGSNNTQYGMLLKSEIQLKGCELLEVRLINLQRMVQKQEIFLDYWGKVSECLDQTESNGFKLLNNKEEHELINFLALVDMYFNASEEIPPTIFRLKNKFNEFESILKSHVKSNEYDKYMPIMQFDFNSILEIEKNGIDQDNEKSVDDFLKNEPDASKQDIFKLYEEKVKLNYSDIKQNYYNNCDTFVNQYLQKKFLLDGLYKEYFLYQEEEKVQEVKVQNIPKKFLTIKRALIILGYIVVIGIIAYLIKKFIINIDESSKIKNAYKLQART